MLRRTRSAPTPHRPARQHRTHAAVDATAGPRTSTYLAVFGADNIGAAQRWDDWVAYNIGGSDDVVSFATIHAVRATLAGATPQQAAAVARGSASYFANGDMTSASAIHRPNVVVRAGRFLGALVVLALAMAGAAIVAGLGTDIARNESYRNRSIAIIAGALAVAAVVLLKLATAAFRRIGRASVTGVVVAGEGRYEIAANRRITVWDARLTSRVDGGTTVVVPITLRGRAIDGQLPVGHTVTAYGRWRPDRTFQARDLQDDSGSDKPVRVRDWRGLHAGGQLGPLFVFLMTVGAAAFTVLATS